MGLNFRFIAIVKKISNQTLDNNTYHVENIVIVTCFENKCVVEKLTVKFSWFDLYQRSLQRFVNHKQEEWEEDAKYSRQFHTP